MDEIETRAFRAWPSGDEPHDIRPLSAKGIGALIAGLGHVRHDVERSMIEAARVMRLLVGEEDSPDVREPEEFVRLMADQWLRSFGGYVAAGEVAEQDGDPHALRELTWAGVVDWFRAGELVGVTPEAFAEVARAIESRYGRQWEGWRDGR